MNRQKAFQEIGNLKPSISAYNPNVINYSSIFIIPTIHNIHKIKDVQNLFDLIDKNWEVRNNSIEKDLQLFDIKEYIKESSFENIHLKNIKELKNFVYDKKNIYLRYKKKNIEFIYDDIPIILKEIDLWIMDGNITFFAYKIELNTHKTINIDTISTKLNRNFRDYKDLSIDIDKNIFYHGMRNNGIPFLSYLLSLTYDRNRISFLNIKNIEQNSKDFLPIQTSTYYAKMITALHIDEDSISLGPITPISDTLSKESAINLGILEELSYILGTASTFNLNTELSYTGYEGYIYPIIKNNGINIWKFWSGIALQDSLAFFSIAKGGSNIVFNSKTNLYFIYIIDLYINIKLKFLEQYLIDKDFINIERILPSLREIQVIKNHYLATEISVKFQPNHINKKIHIGLNNLILLNEIENNLQKTMELTKSNTDIVFSIAAGVATLGSMWLTSDLIFKFYNEHPFLTLLLLIAISIFIMITISKRSLFIRLIKNSFKSIKRLLQL